MSLRVVPGAVGATSLRALVLAKGGPPDVRVLPQAQAVSIAPIAVSDALKGQLRQRGNISLFEAVATGLTSARDYTLSVTHAGTTKTVPFRTLDGAQRDLRIVLGSCYYDDWGGIDGTMLRSVHCKGASFKVLTGDNLYLDVARDTRDIWGGYEETVHRYLHYFWTSRYSELLGTLPTFTTWDDHEFWNNYPEPQLQLARTSDRWRASYVRAGHECLLVFQAVLNGPIPDARNAALDGLRNLSYRIPNTGPVSFFVADVRSARTRVSGAAPRFMHDNGLADLRAWGNALDRPGVLVLGQPLWIRKDALPNGAQKFVDFRLADFDDQYARVWDIILGCRHDILILSGDVHHSHAITIAAPNGKMVHEFVSSPMSHIPSTKVTLFPPGINLGPQDRGQVAVPDDIKVGGRKLTLHRYRFGTSLPSSMSVLNFQGLPSGEVSVSGAFLDRQGRPVPAEPAGAHQPEFAQCGYREIFTLR